MKKIDFTIDSFEVLEEQNDSQFTRAKIQAFASDANKHDLYCSEEVLKETAHTLYSKPVVYDYDYEEKDMKSHTTPDKTFIAGYVVPNSAEFIRLTDEKKRLAVIIEAVLWNRYIPHVIETLKNNNGFAKISVEMELFETKERDDGLTEMLSFAYSGISMLGQFIQEACEGSHIQILSFAEEDKKVKKAFMQEFSKYDELDFNIPTKVKSNSEKALSLYKTTGVGGTSASLVYAKFISKNKTITPEKVRSIHKALMNYKDKNVEFEDDGKNSPSKDHIVYMMYGGKDGLRWTSKLVDKMDELDKRQMSFFGEVITSPYKSLDNMDSIETENNRRVDKDKKEKFDSNEKTLESKSFDSSKEEKSVMDKNKDIEKDEKEEKMSEEVMSETPFAEDKSPEEKDKKFESEDEQKEEEKQEKTSEEAEKEDMSNDSYMDVSAMMAFLEKETDNYSDVKEEFAKEKVDYAKVVASLFSAMQKMSARFSEEKENFAKENEDLKKFKADFEAKQFETEVAMTMKEVEGSMPEKEMASLFEDSKNFSLKNIENWKNGVKAKAFTFSKDKKIDVNSDVMKVGLPFANVLKKSDSLWG